MISSVPTPKKIIMSSKEVLKINLSEQNKDDDYEKTPPVSSITIISYWLLIIILVFLLSIGLYTFVMLKNPLKSF